MSWRVVSEFVRTTARVAVLLAVTVVLLVGAGGVVSAPPALGQPVTPTTSAAEPSPVLGGTNGPRPVGEPLPPRSQRIGDSLIWLWVMAVLVGGTIAGYFAGR